MRKGLKVGLIVLVLLAFAILICPSPTETEVRITMNLEEDGWYWTHFHLPPQGELMAKSTLSEYWSPLGRIEFHGRLFVGMFCCGETLTGRYVFLPTHKLRREVSTLLFFSPDGSVWQIDVPNEIRFPQSGETSTKATIYW